MLKRLTLAFVSIMLLSQSSMAAGTFAYSLKTDEGFMRVDIKENEAVREGVWSYFGNRLYLTSFVQDNRLYLPLAQYQKDGLDIKVYDEKHTWYRGFLWFSVVALIDTYHDLKRGTMVVQGKIGENLTFEYRTFVSKKGKKTATLTYLDKGQNYPTEMNLYITFTPEKAEGSCNGKLMANQTYEVARMNCTSSGKMKDALFFNDQDFIAWVIHLMLIPSDAKINLHPNRC